MTLVAQLSSIQERLGAPARQHRVPGAGLATFPGFRTGRPGYTRVGGRAARRSASPAGAGW